MHILNKFFDKIYCINLLERPDRKQLVQERFDKLGIEVEFLNAVKFGFANNIIQSNLFNFLNKNQPNEFGCTLSHYQCIKKAYLQGYNNVLIFEDDVKFYKNFNNIIEQKLNNVPDNWDLLYLYSGIWLWNENHQWVVENELLTSNECWTALGYAINKKFMGHIINYIDNDCRTIDTLFVILQNLQKYNIYSIYPNVCAPDLNSKSNLLPDNISQLGFDNVVTFGDFLKEDYE